MSREDTAPPREFLLKQIENEINAGFVFVEAARRALKQNRQMPAAGAMEQASAAQQQIQNKVADSPVAQVRNIIHQLSELREAIDWLRFTHFEESTQK